MKKAVLISLLFVVGRGIAIGQSTDLAWPVVTKMSKPWTRWWWFGNAVDTMGLRYNLKTLHRAGIGGTELSLIYGTKGYENRFINFLSPKWMQMYGYTVSESKKLGMGVDLTGGSGWPFGGPNIPIQNSACYAIFQKYRLHTGESLKVPVVVKKEKEKEIAPLQVLMAYSKNGQTINLTDKVGANGYLNWKASAGNWTLIAVFNGKTFQKVKRASPGGKGWVMDPFSKKALFIYLKRFTKAFKRSESLTPHAFFCDSYEVFGADWSPNFFKEFYKLQGYYLQDYLPQLLGMEKKDIVGRVRQDYRQTISDMLLNNFVIPWSKWTHKMGSITRYQAHGSPGNLLDLYAAVDIPETETFGHKKIQIDDTQVTTINPFFMKFASSAAHISGKKIASSETFTWMIEHFRFRPSIAKPILDQLFLSGVNHVVFQGTPYSPKGAPWPGWQFYASVNLSPYNSMWPDMKGFDRYITRSQSFLQAGKPDNDLLLYWPIQDLWYNLKKPLLVHFATNNINKWLRPTSFYAAAKRMKQMGYSLDYISDRYLQETKTVDGMLQTPGARYKALVVPPCKFMPIATLQAVLRLIKNGGKVIFLNHMPKDAPGLGQLAQRREKFKQLLQYFPETSSFIVNQKHMLGKGEIITGHNLKKELALAKVPKEQMVDLGLKYERRKMPDGTVYFIKNPHTHKKVDCWVPLGVSASSAGIYDPYTGKKGVAETRSVHEKTQIYLQLNPGQSLIVRTYGHKKITGKLWKYYTKEDHSIILEGPWKFSFGKGWPSIPGHFTIEHLHSWTSLNDSARTFAGTGIYRIHFKVSNGKADNWLLKLGKVNYGAKVTLNGYKVGTLWAFPFEVQIGSYLRKGENTLKIKVSNNGANRIAFYDRTNRKWKIFYNINVVNTHYKPFDASGWKTIPSGLFGPITLTPLLKRKF
jgi:hypothetical protein